MYEGIKHSHMLFITLSILLFEYRYFRKVFNKKTSKFLKIFPHVNDTLLLISGVSLAIIASIKPWEQPWLAAKIVALLVYIAFAMVALKSSGKKSVFSYIFATAAFIFMLFTAVSKNPYFFLL